MTYKYNMQNLMRLNQRIDALVNDYSKLLVIRIDFGIKKEWINRIDSDYMKKAFIHLRNNMRNQQIFNNLITFVAKLEYGEEKHWHYHIIFFFDGQVRNKDMLISRQIGEYWITIITKGIGVYYAANLHHEDYRFNGIGMIDHYNKNKIKNLKTAAKYLTKIDFNIHQKLLIGNGSRTIRTFFMGEYKPRNSLYGRPRIRQNIEYKI